MRHRPLLALLVAATVSTSALACSKEDGRALPPPRVLQTTTTPSTPVIQPSPGAVDAFTLTSSSFVEGSEIPSRLTCEGEGLSPALSWSGAPPQTATLALVVRDRSAGGYVHWVVTGIDSFVTGVGEGGLPENAVEGRNGDGEVGWLAPCPPPGSGTHVYEVVLLALTDLVELPLDAPAEEAAATLEAAASSRAVLTGTVAAG